VNFGFDLEPRQLLKIKESGNSARVGDVAIYHDYSPYMLISENSLVDLNTKLKNPVTMRNFRPNFTAKDCQAFNEVKLKLMRFITNLYLIHTLLSNVV
jgi:uncharacterized protein